MIFNEISNFLRLILILKSGYVQFNCNENIIFQNSVICCK